MEKWRRDRLIDRLLKIEIDEISKIPRNVPTALLSTAFLHKANCVAAMENGLNLY